MFISHHQNAGQNHNFTVANMFLEKLQS